MNTNRFGLQNGVCCMRHVCKNVNSIHCNCFPIDDNGFVDCEYFVHRNFGV